MQRLSENMAHRSHCYRSAGVLGRALLSFLARSWARSPARRRQEELQY
jgi:hypothetical protein